MPDSGMAMSLVVAGNIFIGATTLTITTLAVMTCCIVKQNHDTQHNKIQQKGVKHKKPLVNNTQ